MCTTVITFLTVHYDNDEMLIRFNYLNKVSCQWTIKKKNPYEFVCLYKIKKPYRLFRCSNVYCSAPTPEPGTVSSVIGVSYWPRNITKFPQQLATATTSPPPFPTVVQNCCSTVKINWHFKHSFHISYLSQDAEKQTIKIETQFNSNSDVT